MNRSSNGMVRKLALVSALVLPMLLVGCSSDAAEGPGTTPAPDTSLASLTGTTVATGSSEPVASSPTDPDSTPTSVVPVVTSITEQPGSADDDFVGAAKDVTLESCQLTGDKWVAKGTVTNESGSDATYRIYVALNAPGSTDTKALVQSDVTVADGKTESWSAEADVATPGLTCILRVERAAA